MLGIIIPLPAECQSLYRHRVKIGATFLLRPSIAVKISGMGPQRAVAAAQALKKEGVNAILNWGCAAALVENLMPGQLLLPKILITQEGNTVKVDEHWRTRIQKILAGAVTFHSASLAASDEILATPTAKRELYAATGAAAADMESAALARWAEAKKIPFVALRAVADHSESRIPDAVLAATDDTGGIALPRLLHHLLRHPTQIFALLALGRQFSAARTSLTAAGKLLLPHHFCLS